MEIYIEDVFINNFFITLIFLFISKLLLRQGKVLNFIFASIFGGVCSVLYPLIYVSNTLLLLIKVIIGIIICLIAYPTNKIKTLFFSVLSFFVITAIFGGICIFFEFNFNTSFSLFSICLIIIASSFFVYFWIESTKIKQKQNQYIFVSEINNNNKRIKFNAFLDTGNCLFDKDNNPVAVINVELFTKIFSDEILLKIITKKFANLKNERYIECGTVNKKSNMLIFNIEELNILINGESKKYQDVNVGLSFNNFKNACKCDMILHPMLF